MIKPKKLNVSDKVAAISLSWGGPGARPHRYEAGKKQLEEAFGVQVIPTKHALEPADWIYKHPEARAQDLMEAFADLSIKAIISTIGGEESVRTLPFIDYNIIRNNPKIFLGFSDTTITHFCCYKAGLVSFYGTSIMCGFAENGGMFSYTKEAIKKVLFSNEVTGEIKPNTEGWTNEPLPWADPANQPIKRKLEECTGWRWIQGNSKVRGKLMGGCMEVLEFMKCTSIWPDLKEWEGAILFLETSEEMPPSRSVLYWLRNYAAQGILHKVSGIIVGRAYRNYKEDKQENYDDIFLKVARDENGLTDLPIVTNMDFGHTDPTFVMPYGVQAEIDCVEKKFTILESGTE